MVIYINGNFGRYRVSNSIYLYKKKSLVVNVYSCFIGGMKEFIIKENK